MSEEKFVKIELKGGRIIIEQVAKKQVNSFNFINGTREQHYNYACFELIDNKKMRYFPFNKEKYLSYEEKLPPITERSCVIPTQNAMQALNQMLASRMWMIWGQDEEYIERELSNG